MRTKTIANVPESITLYNCVPALHDLGKSGAAAKSEPKEMEDWFWR